MLSKINFELDENFLPTGEPMAEFPRDEVYNRIHSASLRDNELAILYAGVFNEGVHLDTVLEWDPLDDDERRILEAERSAWRELEWEMTRIILGRMNYVLLDDELPIGYYHAVTPFMNEHGFSADYNIYIRK